jgi:nucleotide-binding universal stress UspA family protein
MHDLVEQRSAAPPATHRVLVLAGGAPTPRLLDLAHSSVPRGARLEVFTLNAEDVHAQQGTAALRDASSELPLPSVRAVLRALHETRADALVLGCPDQARARSDFTDIVERAHAAASIDLIVCVDRHERPWNRVLVPYLYGPLDDGALRMARRLARSGDAAVTVLHVVEPATDDEGVHQLRASIDGCALKIVTSDDPIAAAAAETRAGYDLIVLGGRERPTPGRYFTMRQQRLLLTTDATLVIVHAGRPPAG